MYTDEDIGSAVKAGVLSEESAQNFRAYVSSQRGVALAEEEQFRVVSGFNDVFVSLACLISLFSVYWLAEVLSESVSGFWATAVAAWIISEYFSRKRYMALPSIVLALAVTLSFYGVALTPVWIDSSNWGFWIVLIVAAPLAYWLRFKIPIAITLAAGGVVICSLVIWGSFFSDTAYAAATFFLVSGLIVFAIAVRIDLSDRLRQTRNTDVAFWLHMLAGPLIAHSIFFHFIKFSFGSDMPIERAIAVIALYLFITLISIAFNRRALMVSGLLYITIAVAQLFRAGTFIETAYSYPITGLIIGLSLLVITVYWTDSRKRLLKSFPDSLRKYLP